MNREKTTKFISNLLVSERFSGIGKCWASEVSLDYGTTDVKRIDFLQFEPVNQMSVSGLEKGIFVCYEVKSCKADFNSGFGRNFIAEKNYFVMPMKTYKEVIQEIPHHVGVLVPIPRYANKHDEFENPTEFSELDDFHDWELASIKKALPKERKRSMTELLFCMLRSKR